MNSSEILDFFLWSMGIYCGAVVVLYIVCLSIAKALAPKGNG